MTNSAESLTDYEITARLEEASKGFEDHHDEPYHEPIMHDLYQDYAEISYDLGIAEVISIECADTTFRVDARGYPIDQIPSAHHGLTRVDLAQWRIEHPHETHPHR